MILLRSSHGHQRGPQQQDCHSPAGTGASCRRPCGHTAAPVAPDLGPGVRLAAAGPRDRLRVASGNQTDAEAGGGRALGAPHRGWLPWHSRDRKPRHADWSPCCHRSKSLLGSGLSALNMRRRGSGQTLTGPAVPGAVQERHLPRGHHHETGPVFAFAGNT